MSTVDMLAPARELFEADLSVVQARADGSKAPVGDWKHLQKQRLSWPVVEAYFKKGHPGIGIVCGAVSGGVEVIEFEGRAMREGLFERAADLAKSSGLGEVWDRAMGGHVVQSPSGGLHILVRVTGGAVPGNTKLASRPMTADELAEWKAEERRKAAREKDEDKRAARLAKIEQTTIVPLVLIETRGEGGFVVTAPSHGTVHPSGKPYVRHTGTPADIAVVTAEELHALHALLVALDQMPVAEPTPVRKGSTASGKRPGDQFNSTATWDEILTPHGWALVYTDDTGTSYWRRPGKDVGVSATTGRNEADRLYVFTTSTEFEAGKSYDKFAALAVLEHGGNFAATAKALRAKGLGVEEPVIFPPPSAPMRVARQLVEPLMHGGVPTLRFFQGDFYRWTGTHWAPCDEHAMRDLVWQSLEHAVYLVKDGDRIVPADWDPRPLTVAGVQEALRVVASTGPVRPPGWLDGRTTGPVVALQNGVLDLASRTLGPLDPMLFNTFSLPFDHDPLAPQPIRWLRFLAEVLGDEPGAIELLQEWFGYILSGRQDIHKILFLLGPTRAGKGTISRVLKHLIGAANVAWPSMASLSSNFGASQMIGKPLAVVADARLGRHSDTRVVELLLNVSGGDEVQVDRKYRTPWTGLLPTRLMMLSNTVPAFDDSSGVIADRFVVLKLQKSFLHHEDPQLEADLFAELPGIFLWALEGLDRLSRQGRLTTVATTAEHVQQMRHSASPLTAFLDAKCEVGDPDFRVVKDELWDAWRVWCRDNEEPSGSRNTFGRALVANVAGLVTQVKLPADEQGRRLNAYGGLRLRRFCQSPGCDGSAVLSDDAGYFGWCPEHLPRGAA